MRPIIWFISLFMMLAACGEDVIRNDEARILLLGDP